MQSESSGPSRHLVTYADGQHVFTQGEKGEEMYIIQDGHVEIVLEAKDGGVVSLATLERGDFFGEMAVIEGGQRTATARSKGGCSVLPLRGSLFVDMLQRDPETTLRIMRKLCSRIRELQGQLSELADGEISFIGDAPPSGAHAVPPSTPPPAAARKVRARLHHANGISLELPDVEEARVGRPDSAVGSVPEIDLTSLNEARTVSRSHARILQRDGKLFVVAEPGTTNGTFVVGERLEAGAPREVHAGDTITFGTVNLVLAVD